MNKKSTQIDANTVRWLL